jgi:hypothetical protein
MCGGTDSRTGQSPEGVVDGAGKSGQLLLGNVDETTRGNGWQRRAVGNRVRGRSP